MWLFKVILVPCLLYSLPSMGLKSSNEVNTYFVKAEKEIKKLKNKKSKINKLREIKKNIKSIEAQIGRAHV